MKKSNNIFKYIEHCQHAAAINFTQVPRIKAIPQALCPRTN